MLPPGQVATAKALEDFITEEVAAVEPLLAVVAAAPARSIGRVFSYRFRLRS
jgi:hypothetical protein